MGENDGTNPTHVLERTLVRGSAASDGLGREGEERGRSVHDPTVKSAQCSHTLLRFFLLVPIVL